MGKEGLICIYLLCLILAVPMCSALGESMIYDKGLYVEFEHIGNELTKQTFLITIRQDLNQISEKDIDLKAILETKNINFSNLELYEYKNISHPSQVADTCNIKEDVCTMNNLTAKQTCISKDKKITSGALCGWLNKNNYYMDYVRIIDQNKNINSEKQLIKDYGIKTISVFDSKNEYSVKKYLAVIKTPIEKLSDGTYGNSGILKLDIDGSVFYDLTHSSWWNNSLTYKAYLSMNISGRVDNVSMPYFANSTAGQLGINNNYVWVSPDSTFTTATNFSMPLYTNGYDQQVYFIDSTDTTEVNRDCERCVSIQPLNARSIWDINYVFVSHGNGCGGDSSQNNFNGTCTGITQVQGVFDYGYSSDGTAGNKIELMDYDPSNYLSMSGWIKLSATGLDQALLSNENMNTWEMIIQVPSTNKIRCGAHGTNTIDSTTALSQDVWYYFACISDGTNLSVYINGKYEAKVSMGGASFNDENKKWVLMYDVANGQKLNGVLDEIRIKQSALTTQEIWTEYEQGKYRRSELSLLSTKPLPPPPQMNCNYSVFPYLDTPIKWVCRINNTDSSKNFNCNSYSLDKENNIINVNPDKSNVKGKGTIDSFKSFPDDASVQLVNIEFSKNNIIANEKINLSVICKGITDTFIYNGTVTPIYKDLTEPIDIFRSINENWGYIIAGFLFLIELIFLIKLMTG